MGDRIDFATRVRLTRVLLNWRQAILNFRGAGSKCGIADNPPGTASTHYLNGVSGAIICGAF